MQACASATTESHKVNLQLPFSKLWDQQLISVRRHGNTGKEPSMTTRQTNTCFCKPPEFPVWCGKAEGSSAFDNREKIITKKWNGHLWPITRTVDSGKNWSVRSMKLNPCVSCLQGLHTNTTDMLNSLWSMTNKYNLCPFDLKLLWHKMFSPLKPNHFQDFCEPCLHLGLNNLGCCSDTYGLKHKFFISVC